MHRRATGVFSILISLLALIAVPALAGDPVPGTYTSVEYGSGSQDVLTGRDSNSRPADAVFNTHSWDGAALGTQWMFTCGISGLIQPTDLRDANGNGIVLTSTIYAGGTFWLSKDGPWGDGVNDLTGALVQTVRITTAQYLNWVPVSVVENVNTSGNFDNSNCILDFVTNNGVGIGDTDYDGPVPADYPAFLDPNCDDGVRVSGTWGDVRDIVMEMSCALPTQTTSWGHVKALYE
jgi:hypothetical protein